MARPLRIEYPGALYHITSRGNEKKSIFEGDQDREAFLDTLALVNERYHWLCHAYCLMDNHYHLLVETLEGNLSLGMRQLNGVVTQAHNRRYHKTGHLFQGRYKAILIQKDSHLVEVCRYVVLNPVRAGMVAGPEDWKWSSYRATAGREPSHPCLHRDWVLDQFGTTEARAVKEYSQFVQAGIGKETIWRDVKGQILLGEEDFVAGLSDHLRTQREIPEIPRSQRHANRPGLEELFSRDALKDRSKRDRKIVAAVEEHGYTQRAVADHLGLHFTYVSQIVTRARQ